MKTQLLLGALVALVSISTLNAQSQSDRPAGHRPPPGEGGPGGRPGRHHPMIPVITVLDANRDHVISADEIKNAPAALAKLDKNGDGQLSADEIMPPRPQEDKADATARPVPPVIAALDTNKDGVISADEIANASAALLTLDANGDGQLTGEELRPPRRDNDGAKSDDGGDKAPRGHRPPPRQQN